MLDILFHGWQSVGRVALMSALIYLLVVAALRVFGAKALAKMSGYDLVVTVTLGSLLANIALSSTFSVADGVTAVLALLVLQEGTRRLQKRSSRIHHLVRERPRLVVWDGEFVEKNLEHNQLTEDEVRAAVRRTGLLSLTQVQAVVLENDGEWSVMPRSTPIDLSALHGLEVPGRPDSGRDDSTDEWPAGGRAHAGAEASRAGEHGDDRGDGGEDGSRADNQRVGQGAPSSASPV